MMDAESFSVGDLVITPSGRRAIVKRILSGASKFDCFSRIICRYEDGKPGDLVTLQPHQLRIAEQLPIAPPGWQLRLAF